MVATLLDHPHPDELAVVDATTRTTWRVHNERINRLANGLAALGLEPADRVLLVVPNRRELLEVVQACRHTGLVVIPASPTLTAPEITYLIDDATPAVVVTTGRTDLPATYTGVHLVVGPGGSYEQLLADSAADEPTQQPGTLMLYTSGTSGRPKGVRPKVTSPDVQAMQAALRGLGRLLGYPDGGRALVTSPAYHSAPLVFTLVSSALGATVHLATGFDPTNSLAYIEQQRITALYAVPTHFVRWLKLSAPEREHDLRSLQFVFHTGAPCAPEVKAQMIDWFGPVITEAYGASEGGIVAVGTSSDFLDRPGTVGRLMPTFDAVVVDEDRRPVPEGTVGQLYFRNRQGGDFAYHGDDAKTADAHLEPGVFTFGDTGYVEDGYVFLSGRAIELIITGGVNVYPAEVEAALLTHPAVNDVGVIGAADPDLGEQVVAVVELDDPAAGSPEVADELRSHCRERLASFKVPKRIVFAPLPRTEIGKLLKRELHAQLDLDGTASSREHAYQSVCITEGS